MNNRSLDIIEEAMEFSPKFSSLEIANGSIYLDFKNVALSNPKEDEDFTLSIRFASNAFISFFYNDIWDLDFLSDYDFSNESFIKDFSYDINEFKFQDFDFLDYIFNNYSNEKSFPDNNFNPHNIRNDFFLTFTLDKLAICISSNEMDFFTKNEKLDSSSIKNLSNEWILYILNYCNKKRIKKDSICDKILKS
ncbi:hypothetical protein [Methanobrevibacter sp. DSM 116169]|uniref:hypothetical protein n=1 Tax=Methanobrevibacter sp. DSM 116169 TaxID=3242727 RepID=UPI0038FC7429